MAAVIPMPMLQWDDDGVCTNPPDGWDVRCTLGHCGGQSVFGRAQEEDGEETQDFGRMADAALSIEAMLWKLGVMPLPEWPAEADSDVAWIEIGDGASATRAYVWHTGNEWVGDIRTYGNNVTDSACRPTRARAIQAAESFLRAAIADALEVGADNG
ncbi:MAG: hypothetical protein FJ100_24025 [Deltaproteobacteria bacterium]|nr:hypothetical protein [Deltaproteobacteria bacterium]